MSPNKTTVNGCQTGAGPVPRTDGVVIDASCLPRSRVTVASVRKIPPTLYARVVVGHLAIASRVLSVACSSGTASSKGAAVLIPLGVGAVPEI